MDKPEDVKQETEPVCTGACKWTGVEIGICTTCGMIEDYSPSADVYN